MFGEELRQYHPLLSQRWLHYHKSWRLQVRPFIWGNSDDLAKARKWASKESERRMWTNKVPREIFKAIMMAQFITPSESRFRAKSFSRNAEQVRTTGNPFLCSSVLEISIKKIFCENLLTVHHQVNAFAQTYARIHTRSMPIPVPVVRL